MLDITVQQRRHTSQLFHQRNLVLILLTLTYPTCLDTPASHHTTTFSYSDAAFSLTDADNFRCIKSEARYGISSCEVWGERGSIA